MKKSEFILLILLVFLFSGCSKKITCIKESEDVKSVVDMKFKDDIISKSITIDEKFFNEDDAYIEMYYYEQKNTYSPLDDIEGVKYKIKENKSSITTKLEVDFDTLVKNNSNLIKLTPGTNINAANSIYTGLGYVCK